MFDLFLFSSNFWSFFSRCGRLGGSAGCLVVFGMFVYSSGRIQLVHGTGRHSIHCRSHLSDRSPPIHVVTRAVLTLSFFNRVFSIRQQQEPEPEPATRTQNPEPRTQYAALSVPTLQVIPPARIHPYEATQAFQKTLPRLRNINGQFTHRTKATTLRPAVFTPEGSPTGTSSSLPSSSVPSSPSSITFSEKPSSNGTPATSPAPQPALLPPPARRNMSDHKGSLQWEGSTDDNLSAGQFLREIENKIDERAYTTEKQKVNCLRNNIAYGSGADEWFSGLAATEKDTYEHLTIAFEKQWPLTIVPKASKAERIQTLRDWTLASKDLGKKIEGPGGGQMWSHVKWATGLASRARDAEDTIGLLLTDVYNSLPRPVRELTRSKARSTYDELATAVLNLDVNDLKEAAADFSRDEETARPAREPASPTKAIREALATTRLQNQAPYPVPTPQYNVMPNVTIPSNTFGRTGGRGNLFGPLRGAQTTQYRGAGPGTLGIGRGFINTQAPTGQPLRDRPMALRHQDLVQYALPHHPKTAEGAVAYRAQVVAWHAANPNIKPDEQHPYPLTPGSLPVGSRECWGCGEQGHPLGAPVCAGAILPLPERDWRRIASYITRTFNRERLVAAQSVNYIGYSPYTPYPGYGQHQTYSSSVYEGEIDDGQGNGQGLSA